MLKYCFILTLIGFWAQAQVQQLDEVVLRAQRINSPIQPLSATLVSDSLQLLLQQDIGERLHTVPSLFVSSQQNFTQDTRISIRGFGARAAFGIRGIKILLDGIPVTTPDGQTQLDHIPLSQLGDIEVLRGLSGGLYGNASGGVILLKSTPINTQKNIAVSIADFDSRSVVATLSKAYEKNHFRAIVEHKNQEGFRAWSAYENTLVSLSNTLFINSENHLTLDYSFFNSPFAQDSGGLTQLEVEQNRRQARQANIDYMAGEKVKQHYFSARFKNNNWASYLFYVNRHLDARLPFAYGGQIDLMRHYFGVGTYRNGAKNQWKWQYGLEGASQRDLRKRFENKLGTKGAQTLHQNEHFHSVSSYGIVEKEVSDWHIRGALRADLHQISLADFLGTQADKKTLSALSPSIAVHRELSKFFNGYVRWGTGFETPSLNELSANPSGETGFNSALSAQKSEEIEVGLRYSEKTITLGVTLFNTTTKNEIIPYEVETFPSQTFYANLGNTKRKGVEIDGMWHAAPRTKITMVFSHGNYETETKRLLPNVPKNQFNSEVKRLFKRGGLAVNIRYVGKRFAENGNTIVVPSFWTTDISIQHYWGKIRATVGATNLSNTLYFDNLRINAFGGRYFEPAAKRQVYFRMMVSL